MIALADIIYFFTAPACRQGRELATLKPTYAKATAGRSSLALKINNIS